MDVEGSDKENRCDEKENKIPVHIEIEVSSDKHDKRIIKRKMQLYLDTNYFGNIKNGRTIVNDKNTQQTLVDVNIKSFNICIGNGDISVPYKSSEFIYHIYELHFDGRFEETQEDSGNNEEITSASYWNLPCKEFDTLWESLIYENDSIKNGLLNYVETALKFSDSKINQHLIAWNRVVLLHGPPGTGKTSLCKALSHKLAIRMSHRYKHGVLFEINAHSLFSKWFSESGKLVLKLFDNIRELLEDKDTFVCLLIDEVESLAAARKNALSGTEPSDSVRVVNALLTQLDSLKTEENVIILTTSNITQAIDIAFVDRADIKQYIGYPSEKARYQILLSCISELQRCKFIVEMNNNNNNKKKNDNNNNSNDKSNNNSKRRSFGKDIDGFLEQDSDIDAFNKSMSNKSIQLPNYDELKASNAKTPMFGNESSNNSSSQWAQLELAYGAKLNEINQGLKGSSGRYLRKLPFIVFANHVQSSNCSMKQFINALSQTVINEKQEKEKLNAQNT